MRRAESHTGRLGRRELLRGLCRAGTRTGLALMLFCGIDGLGRTSTAEAAPSAPPRPGAPPDKQTPSGIAVLPNDPAITAGPVEYPGIIGPLLGYLTAPKGTDVYPGILLIHDSQGLVEHFKDITRRLAKAGFVALAPDLASRAGGADKLGSPAKVLAALRALPPGHIQQDLNASVRYLETHPLVAKTRIGAIGFGLGGNVIWLVLTANPDVKAAVSISGIVPSPRAVPSLRAPVLAIFGENDKRDEEGIADFDAAMKQAGLAFTVKLEPKAGHDFFNDTASWYVPEAAKDAWGLTLDWFVQHLKG
jgi:carboxymethylenebutenolidase